MIKQGKKTNGRWGIKVLGAHGRLPHHRLDLSNMLLRVLESNSVGACGKWRFPVIEKANSRVSQRHREAEHKSRMTWKQLEQEYEGGDM